MKLYKNLVLVGMMGSGKSLIGKILSRKLNFDFIDTDSQIEEKEKKAIPEIFKINGEKYSINIEEDIPLLWVIRDILNMTGTKYGCGIQQCGACTVLVNKKPIRSCGVTVNAIAGKEITTIEGLSNDNSHPVQKAWIEEQVPQCGYCQSGQIMTAVSLLERFKNPDDKIINRIMTGICRCGTYPRIRKAIHKAAKIMEKTLV